MIRNNDVLNLDMDLPDEGVDIEEEYDLPDRPFPTQWKWSLKSQKKAPAVFIDSTNLAASRFGISHNPGVMTTAPFTRNSWYFQARLNKIGKFVGIGVADLNYMVSGGTTLGSQVTGLNCAYFWQNNGIQRIQMYGEERIRVAPLVAGDRVGIMVDFSGQCIYFFRNFYLEACMKCSHLKLEDGKVYPCINLSDGTDVVIENVEVDPTKQGDKK